MRIDFKHIDIEGFMSIGKASVDLDENGLTLVSGTNKNPADNSRSNGAGKSTIFEAIVYSLIGETLRGTKDVVNMNYPDGMKVELTLMRGEDLYKIVRARNHKELKTCVMFYKNDEDISGKSMKDCDEVILSYLPEIASNIVTSVIILGQGLPNRLTSFTPKKRKELLEELSQTGHLVDELKSRLEKRKIAQNCEKDKLDRANRDCEVEIGVLDRDIDKIKNNATIPVDEMKDSMQKYTNENIKNHDELEAKKQDEKMFDGVLSQYQQKESDASSNVRVQQQRISDSENKIIALGKNVCPTCKRPFDNAEQMKIEQDAEKITLDGLKKELEPLIKAYSDAKQETAEVREVKRGITEEIQGINTRIIECNKKISYYEGQIKLAESAQQDMEEKQNRVGELQKKIEGNKEPLSKIETSLTSLGYLERTINKEFKTVLLQGVIEYINIQLEKYSSILFGRKDYVKLVANGNDLDVIVAEKPYENLSGGERQKTDLAVQFALRDMLINITGFSCNIMVLDEVFDNLDDIGCANLLKILNGVFVDLNSIYVITHHTDISIPKDKEIHIVKDFTGCSSVYVLNE